MTSATAGSPLAGAEQTAGTVLERLRASWRNYRAYRATIVELDALTDRQLADAGLSRAALRQTAYGAVYRISR
jgi:uncharacterized protein YjiS (DUF1127 family)